VKFDLMYVNDDLVLNHLSFETENVTNLRLKHTLQKIARLLTLSLLYFCVSRDIVCSTL